MALIFLNGCAVYNGGVETAKTIWGSSTRALENDREQAIANTYNKNFWEVLRGSLEAARKQGYVVFKKDEVKGYLVLMGIPGSVNTTEVGVFFVELGENETRVEVTSLSTNAKRMVSKTLFQQLDILFGLVPSDPEPLPVEVDPQQKP